MSEQAVVEIKKAIRRVTKADEFLTAEDLKPEYVEFEEFGIGVFLRRLNAYQGTQLGKIIDDKDPEFGQNVRVCAFCISDEDGNPLFNTVEGKQKLKEQNLKKINAIGRKALVINGLAPDVGQTLAELQKKLENDRKNA